MNESTKIGRLALRREGEYWNAYYAMPDTMADAILLGSIRMRLIEGSPEIRQLFIDVMRAAVGVIVKEATGVTPTWPEGEQPAPEHERTGHS